MSYLCLDCTRTLLAESETFNLPFDGISYEDAGIPLGAVCARCGIDLPEDEDREMAAQNLILKALIHAKEHDVHHFRTLAQDKHNELVEAQAEMGEARGLVKTAIAMLDTKRRRMRAARQILEGGRL